MELSTDALVTETGTGTNAQPFGVLVPNPALLDAGHQGGSGGKYFTIQRVNGNGANGKNEGVGSGGHKHTLEESDRVKKNSVQRFLLKEAQERKKAGVRSDLRNYSDVTLMIPPGSALPTFQLVLQHVFQVTLDCEET